MKHLIITILLASIFFLAGCSGDKYEEKGFQIGTDVSGNETTQASGVNPDSLTFPVSPGSVLLTGVPNVRLTPVYKINFNKRDKTSYTGSNSFYYRYEEDYTGINTQDKANNWNSHLMPGLEAVYGYNMINISHYNLQEGLQKKLFEKPVLVRTLYYPAFSKDTLNYEPVSRNFFIVSVYDEDTNKDNFINTKDLRRLYLFDINGENKKALVPKDYSVYKSEYDSGNDYMYIYARQDANKNGRQDNDDPVHIFWIDLKDPHRTGRQY